MLKFLYLVCVCFIAHSGWLEKNGWQHLVSLLFRPKLDQWEHQSYQYVILKGQRRFRATVCTLVV